MATSAVHKAVLSLLLTLVASAPGVLAECPYENCLCSSWADIDCKNLNLTTLQLQDPGANYSYPHLYLDISFNDISSLEGGSMYPGIEVFRSRGNPLTHISDDAFQGLEHSLVSLTIDHSSLTSLPRAMANLTSLSILYLNYNNISDPDIAFGPSTHSIYMDHNQLDSIPPSISDLGALQSLWIMNNKIKSINDIEFPSNLMTLKVEENAIEDLTMLRFHNNASIFYSLNLQGNPLKTVSPDAFEFCTRLQRLDLSNTQITRLPLALTSLERVYTVLMTDIASLVCTCQESAIGEMYRARLKVKHDLDVRGKCGVSRIDYFLGTLSAQCPPSNQTLPI